MNNFPFKRRFIVWYDFKSNGFLIRGLHPALILYTSYHSKIMTVIPLTTKYHRHNAIVNIGQIDLMENNNSYAKVDQITTIEKKDVILLRDHTGKYFTHFNKISKQYSKPRLSNEQIKLIDSKLKELFFPQ